MLLVGQKLSKLTLSAARRSPLCQGTHGVQSIAEQLCGSRRDNEMPTRAHRQIQQHITHIYTICLCLCPVSCRQSSCSTSTASRGRGLKLKWKLKLRLRLRLELRRLKTESEILRKDSHRHLGRKCSARISHKASTEGTEKTVRGTEVNLIKIITPLWVIT